MTKTKTSPAPRLGQQVKSVPVRGPSSAAARKRKEEDPGKVADTLFGDKLSGPVTLRDGRVLEVRQGKLKHLSLLLSLFTGIVNSLPTEQLIEVSKIFHQRALIAQASEFVRRNEQIPASLAEQIAGYQTSAMTLEAIGEELKNRGGLVIHVLHAVIDVLPKVGAALSNFTEEEIENLEHDEGLIVLGACFVGNYAFFSQSLPNMLPTMMGAVTAQLRKLASK